MDRIGFGKRVLAAIIDGVLIIVVGGVGALVISYFVLLPVLSLLLLALEILRGTSPGKMVMGIQIKGQDGSTAPREVLLKRAALKYACSIFTLVAAITGLSVLRTLGSLVGFIVFLGCFMVLTADKQALHDRFAGTAVYSVN
jgi:uncharacterized RDD family membrane protein YckC